MNNLRQRIAVSWFLIRRNIGFAFLRVLCILCVLCVMLSACEAPKSKTVHITINGQAAVVSEGSKIIYRDTKTGRYVPLRIE